MIKFRNFTLEEKNLDEETINIKSEVESFLKRKMTPKEAAKFRSLRKSGMANPIDIKRELMKEETDLDENQLTAQQVKQGIGIAKDKRYAGGNMSGAVKAMSKLHKNLAKHPAVKKELQKQNEETDLDEAIKLKTKVKIHAPGKDYHEKVGTVGEIRGGLHKGAEKTYTVDYDYNTNTGRSQSIQLNKKNIKLYKEETDLEEASYEIYHRDFSSAVQHAKKQAEKRGYTIDDDEWFRKVASGPRKPSSGKTNSYNIELLDKNGKPIKKNLSMQVYNMDNKKYELNMYTEETDLDEKLEMAENQLYFVVYAAEEILEYIDMGGEVEEWYQNKLSKVHSDMESLHSYVEGEMRRTGMKEETELDESKTLSPGWMLKADPKLGAAVKAAKDLYKKRIAAYGNPAAGVSIKDRTKDGKNVKKEETELDEAKKTFSDYANEYKKLTGKKAPAGTSTQAMMLMVDKAKRAKAMKEEKQLDPVNKKELKKDFSDRTDKDIDNDGDVDDSDEYLHNRRKAISKNVKEESNLQELKKSTLLSYIKKSSKDARLASTVGDKEVIKKRTKGIEKAAGKLSETKQMSPALKALFDKMDKESVKRHNTYREKELARVAALPKEKPLDAAEKAKLTAELKKLQSDYSSLERSDAPGTATKLGYISSNMDRIHRALKAK